MDLETFSRLIPNTHSSDNKNHHPLYLYDMHSFSSMRSQLTVTHAGGSQRKTWQGTTPHSEKRHCMV